jgi:hypothetical protein
MNCAQAREQLPELLYGELGQAEAAAVESHRGGCPACQAEFSALERVRDTLNALPAAPAAHVDLARLYADASKLQLRRIRLWRRSALALFGAAAVLLVVIGLKLELRVNANEFVVRWSSQPEVVSPAPEPPQAPQVVRIEHAPPTISAEEFQLMNDLIHAVAADVDTRDRRRQQEVSSLQARFLALQDGSQQRDRIMTALYTAQFGIRDKGEKP